MSRPHLSAPLGADIKITNRCNLGCRHCIAESGSAGARELTRAEILNVIDQLAGIRVFYVGLTGGEPFLRGDFFDILDHANAVGLRVGVSSNGTLIDGQVAAELRSRGVSLVRVSLDGAEAASHDGFRGTPGAFRRTCAGIRSLVAEGLNVTVLTVISRRNFRCWEDMIPLCRELGVKALNCYLFVPAGRGKQMASEALTPEEHRQFLKRVVELQAAGRDVQLVTETPMLAAIRESSEAGSCPAGVFEIFIRENGDVTPCPYFPVVAGNVRLEPIVDIWRRSAFMASIRDRSTLSPVCQECKFCDACFGGCRAAAFCECGTLTAPDPNCWLAAKAAPA